MTIFELLFSWYGILFLLNHIAIHFLMYAETEAHSSGGLLEISTTKSTICKYWGRIGMLIQVISAIIASFQYEWWAAFILLIVGTVLAIIAIKILYIPLREWHGGKYNETNPLVALDNEEQYAAKGRRHIINFNMLAIFALSISMLIVQFSVDHGSRIVY